MNIARTPQEVLEVLKRLRPEIKSLREVGPLEAWSIGSKFFGRRSFIRNVEDGLFHPASQQDLNNLVDLMMKNFVPPGAYTSGRIDHSKVDDYRAELKLRLGLF